MDISRPSTAGMTSATTDVLASDRAEVGRQRLVAVGGILGALAASSCCIVPLILFSLGIGGAWIGNLTVLEPYRPIFIGAALVAMFFHVGSQLINHQIG